MSLISENYNMQYYSLDSEINNVWLVRYFSECFYIAAEKATIEPVIYKCNKQGEPLEELILKFSDNSNISVENISIADFFFGQDEKFYCVIVENHIQKKQEENFESSANITYSLKYACFDKKGKEIFCIDLKFPKNFIEYVSKALIMEEQNICILTNQELFLFDSKGNLLNNCNINAKFVETAVVNKEGEFYIFTEDRTLKKMDVFKGKTIEEYKTDLPLNYKTWMSYGEEYDFIAANQQGIYGYSCKQKKTVQLLDWMEWDIAIKDGYIQDFFYLGDGNYVLLQDREQEGSCILVVTKQEEEKEEDGKTELVLYVNGSTEDTIKQSVIAWNKEQQDVRIVIKDYANKGINQLALDIASGNGPDIFFPVSFDSEWINYAEKGYFANYYDLMEKTKEGIQKEDILDNIRQIYEMEDGNLYFLPIGFSVRAIAGSKRDISGRKVTLDIVDRLLKTKPEGTKVIKEAFFSGGGKPGLFRLLFTGAFSDFYDNVQGLKVENMAKLLEFIEQWYVEDNKEEDGQFLFYLDRNIDLNGAHYCLKNLESIYGKNKYELIGSPCEEGTGISILSKGDFAIAANGKNVAAAWDFVQSFYQYEEQNSSIQTKEHPYCIKGFAFSIRKDAFEENFQDLKEYQYTNATTRATKKELAMLKAYIEQADRVVVYDGYNLEVQRIVDEEIYPYFEGDKGQEEILDILKNRVNLYTEEKN